MFIIYKYNSFGYRLFRLLVFKARCMLLCCLSKLSYSLVKMHSLKGKYIDVFYSYSFVLVMFICFFVLFLIYSFFCSDWFYKDWLDAPKLEVYWTVVPGFVLFLLSIPSLIALYYQDKVGHFQCYSFFQVLARQWYWYVNDEIEDWFNDCILVKSLDIKFLRNLSVVDTVCMCSSSINHFICTSKDVIHSLCIPEFGIKIDCIAGRFNTVDTLPLFRGVYYGQCSEVCGLNHSYMPIVVTVLSYEDYDLYMEASN